MVASPDFTVKSANSGQRHFFPYIRLLLISRHRSVSRLAYRNGIIYRLEWKVAVTVTLPAGIVNLLSVTVTASPSSLFFTSHSTNL